MVGFGGWWGWPYPYWYDPYPYYGPYYHWPYHPVYAYGLPVYVEQTRAGYWYYCVSAQAYYPTAATCPEPWIAVAPRPDAP